MNPDLTPPLATPYPAPAVDDTVQTILDHAVADLAAARHLGWVGDAATEIHLLASLSYQLNRRLLDTIDLARQQHLTEADIAHLAGMPLHELRQLLDD